MRNLTSNEYYNLIIAIDATQKHNVLTIPLGEYASCICHQAQTCTYGICTGTHSGTHFVRLLEDQTFNVLSAYTLDPYERGLSIVSCLFTADSNEYYCVGTEYVFPEEEDTEHVS
ncbi:hypothetical protein ARALYDRAFT_908112 [Arabidopsis lyrata subsp. lyrata]|uniref:Uncharacterized protein n=1 Tax=Arabidopsis lyrata subsp. lyrata TaxID=81972 RepID=D7M7T5_ARALL|nr:hypothetical protein ARALYDRAFT_908112 [Arabidopsis lyrata subsp. lyrata]